MSPNRMQVVLVVLTAAAVVPGTAQAAEPAETGGSAGISGSAELGGEGASMTAGTETEARSRTGHPLLRHRPRALVTTFGIYGGLYLPPDDHSYVGPGASFRELSPVMGSIGLRIGFFPLSWFGAEIEGGGFPGTLRDDGYVKLYHIRGHALFQLPYRLSAFVLFGPGVIMVDSVASKLGRDPDPALDVGAGARFFVNDWFDLRLEWRGVLSGSAGPNADNAPSLHHEVLLSLGFSFGPKLPTVAVTSPPPPIDTDHDGFLDPNDKCPSQPGVSPDGCPIPDRDGDGYPNEVDACPDEHGVAPDGCPVEDKDRDGIKDDRDACPDEPGIEPDGCPIKDRDKDQILDPDDKCPDEPETRNGFEDTDGCPDELPKEIEKFSGVIQGIYFDLNKATIQKRSNRVLDEAVRVLKKYPSIKVEIVGHTDSTGDAEHNRKLSQERAENVRQYLLDKGVESERVKARGAGEDEPIADNKTPMGRAENRRTEFNIIND